MIVDIDNITIDLSKVERVDGFHHYRNWKRYKVYLSSGNDIMVYEDRERANESDSPTMPRKEFISLWKTYCTKRK